MNIFPHIQTDGWDALGRLTAASNDLGTFGYGYEGRSGRLQQADAALTGATAAGQRTLFTYGPAAEARRLTGILHRVGYFVVEAGSGQVNVDYVTHSEHHYGYDTQGRLSSWQKGASTWALTHDPNDQLTGVEGDGSFAYTYDLAGNRLASTAAGVAREWTANALNQLTGETNGPGYTYDLDGNLLSNGTRTYAWDAENRLVGISGAFGTVAWEYDAFSRRVKQHDTPPAQAEKVRDLIWDGLSLIESRDTSGEVRKYYGHGEEREVPGSDVQRLRYTTDHLGSIRELVDGAGTVLARYDYTPYGERTKRPGDLDCDFGYTGHYTHEASGIILAPYRGYDPTVGRWLSRDPIEEDGGINLYGYVGNRLFSTTDPLGLAGEPEFQALEGAMKSNNAAIAQMLKTAEALLKAQTPSKISECQQALGYAMRNAEYALANLKRARVIYDAAKAAGVGAGTLTGAGVLTGTGIAWTAPVAGTPLITVGGLVGGTVVVGVGIGYGAACIPIKGRSIGDRLGDGLYWIAPGFFRWLDR